MTFIKLNWAVIMRDCGRGNVNLSFFDFILCVLVITFESEAQ